ncbi:phage portal protein [Streptomyces sp. I8-5]|uniref:phage portal protein n=1 Tax=Streptomyces sp. I8-5 TaxID=3104277 RepID=UPI00386F6C8F
MIDIRKQLASRLKSFRSGGWDGRNLSIWSPDHPLNQAAAFAGSSTGSDRERIENDFEAYINGAYKANGPVFACVTARQFVFSEAVFKFRSKQDGKLFGSPELSILETPWPGGTTGELLSRMEQDVSLAGNSWWTLTNDQGDYGNRARNRGTGLRLARLRPDWVTMVIASKSGDPRALDAHLAGVVYTPQSAPGGGPAVPRVLLKANEVAHFSPIPDPAAQLRGLSWLTPVLREIEADKGATKHKGAFFNNAAVPNMAVTFDKETSREDFEEFVEAFNGNHSGAWQAYKTLFLMGGADVTPLSHDFRSMDFSGIVGKGESRIASAAQVPPSWVGFSEGMQGSALNSGNMAANRRRFADGTIRPLWRMAVASLSVLLEIPTGAELWWDESGIAFLREDQRDRAEIMRIDMNAVDAGIKAGFEPDACVEAVEANDIRKLIGKHTGLVSVQMQPPVDPDNEVETDQGQANIMETQAKTIQAFIAAGFTEESARDAVESNDLRKLKKAPTPDGWSPTGQPLMAAPGSMVVPGGKPPAGPGKPAPKKPSPGATTPGGGGNG